MKYLLLLGCLLSSIAWGADDACLEVTVEKIIGNAVTALRLDGEEYALELDDSLQANESIITGVATVVDLRLCDGSVVRIGPQTKFKVKEINNANQFGLWQWTFGLLSGTFRAVVAPSENKEHIKFRVKTLTAAMGVRGTDFVVTHSDSLGKTELQTVSGEVLMGRAEQLEQFKSPASQIREQFRPVKEEMRAEIKKGQSAPGQAEHFSVKEFKTQHEHFFKNELQHLNKTEARERIQKASERRQERRQSQHERERGAAGGGSHESRQNQNRGGDQHQGREQAGNARETKQNAGHDMRQGGKQAHEGGGSAPLMQRQHQAIERHMQTSDGPRVRQQAASVPQSIPQAGGGGSIQQRPAGPAASQPSGGGGGAGGPPPRR